MSRVSTTPAFLNSSNPSSSLPVSYNNTFSLESPRYLIVWNSLVRTSPFHIILFQKMLTEIFGFLGAFARAFSTRWNKCLFGVLVQALVDRAGWQSKYCLRQSRRFCRYLHYHRQEIHQPWSRRFKLWRQFLPWLSDCNEVQEHKKTKLIFSKSPIDLKMNYRNNCFIIHLTNGFCLFLSLN